MPFVYDEHLKCTFEWRVTHDNDHYFVEPVINSIKLEKRVFDTAAQVDTYISHCRDLYRTVHYQLMRDLEKRLGALP